MPHRPVLWAHIIAGVVFTVIAGYWLFRGGHLHRPALRRALATGAMLVVILPLVAMRSRFRPDPRNHIVNPDIVPVAMEGEGGGPKSPLAVVVKDKCRRYHTLRLLYGFEALR